MTTHQWQQSPKLTPCMLALVSMALGVGAKPADLPTCSITTQYWVLDQRGSQCKQTSEVDRGLCMCPPVCS